MKYLTFILILLNFIFSCGNLEKDSDENKTDKDKHIIISDAKLFQITENDHYTILSVFDKTGILKETYYLVDKTKEIPKEIESKSIIRVPVENIICLSTTHISYIDLLGETNKISAISGSQYIYNEKLRGRIETNDLKDVGYENSLDFEMLLKLKPDVVTVYDINGTISPIIQKIKKFNIPVVQINEYLESSAVSQAEWLKFFGELFKKRSLAENHFNTIKNEYENLLKYTDTISSRPKVLLNLPWKGTWYIPGGISNVAQLIHDAGGDYIWKELPERHNIPLNIEDVYLHAADADIWINPGQAGSIDEILSTDTRLNDFKPVKSGYIFNRNKRISSSGGNDYMESGTVRPDLILKDLIKILHPELLPNHKLYYYKKLN